MSNTLRFEMPLLDAAQAQKHVTINEALVRADCLSSRRVESRSINSPPVSPIDGSAYIVGQAATDDWAGEEGNIALALNGGWEFVTPWSGLTMWVHGENAMVTNIAGEWLNGNIALSGTGASTFGSVIEIEHALAAGTTSLTPAIIPDKAIVLGVTGRVLEKIFGPTTWSLGVPDSPNRYGSGYGSAVGSLANGVTGQPQAYFGSNELQLTSDGPAFSGGAVRIAVHYLALSPPLQV